MSGRRLRGFAGCQREIEEGPRRFFRKARPTGLSEESTSSQADHASAAGPKRPKRTRSARTDPESARPCRHGSRNDQNALTVSVKTNPQVINPVSVEEAPAWVRAMLTTFLSSPRGDAATRRTEVARRSWNGDRTWGVRDGGRWVATLLSERRLMTVPGHQGRANDLEVDALTAVTVAATHRRRGLMSRMLTPS